MITLETLPGDKGRRQKRHRVGRGHGSGSGKTSGRGHKGAQARSGYKIKSGFEGGQMPLQRRLPKRGFHNPFRVKTEVVNLASLERCFEEGQTVTPEDLKASRLIHDLTARVKVLGDGDVSKKLTVKAHAFSAKARERLEAAGGACETIS